MKIFRHRETKPGKGTQTPQHKRNRWALAALAVVVAGALLFGKTLQQHLMAFVALKGDAPADAVLEEITGADSHTAAALEKIWKKGQSSGRLFVLRRLSEAKRIDPAIAKKLDYITEEGVGDPDPEVRAATFRMLAAQKHPELRRRLREQLSDADPAVRVLGLQGLLPVAQTNDVPTAIRLLDDPDPRVVVAAGVLLKRATGQDFGLKLAQALPRFTWVAETPPPPADWAAIERGREGWRKWWQVHGGEFPSEATPTYQARRIQRQSVEDFVLPSTEGEKMRLSEFRGKTVLLVFWSLANPESVAEYAALEALQQEKAGHLAVLAVAFDPAIWSHNCGVEDDHGRHGGKAGANGEGHAHGDGKTGHQPPTPQEVRAKAIATAARAGARHPVLVDAAGEIARRYDASQFPLCFIIDGEGRLVRRVAGTRSEAVWRTLVDEAIRNCASPATKKN